MIEIYHKLWYVTTLMYAITVTESHMIVIEFTVIVINQETAYISSVCLTSGRDQLIK